MYDWALAMMRLGLRAKTDSFLVTADLLLEDVHFDLSWTSLSDLGYKTLAVNLSDIAAMGGIPAYVTLSLGFQGILPARK